MNEVLSIRDKLIIEMKRVDALTERLERYWSSFTETVVQLKHIRQIMMEAQDAIKEDDETKMRIAYRVLIDIVDPRMN